MKSNLISLIILSVLMGTTSLAAAIKLDFKTVDIITYRCYQEKKWDSVIMIGKQALRQDIDYYYLRVRMGISYYEKTQYFPATVHLKKARQFNSEDPIIANYLYYAYLYSGRVEEAGLIGLTTTPSSPTTTHSPSLKAGAEIHIEGGYTLSSDKSPTNLSTLMENDSIYGEQDLYGNSFYSNLGLKLRVSKRIGLILAYNYLRFDKTKYIQYARSEHQLISITDISGGKLYNYANPDPWVVYDTSFKYKTTQHEIHIGASLVAGAGFTISPAFHLVHVASTVINTSYRFDSVDYPWYYTSFDSTLYTYPYSRLNYSFQQNDTSFNNYVAALQVTKSIGIFKAGISVSWSNLNGKTQKQVGLSLTYFPLGNLNLYGTTSATGFFQRKDKRLLISQVVGAKFTPWMWGEANFYYGDFTNANIFNGSIVYNNSDIIDYRGGATLTFLVGKHLQLSLIYQYFRKESQQIYYIKTQDPDTKTIKEIQQTKNNPYNTNTIIGGITWKF